VPETRISKPPAEPPAARSLRRLGKNINGYFGETIDIEVVLRDCCNAARTHGWSIEEVPVPGKPPMLAFHRTASAHSLDQPSSDRAASPHSPGHAPRAYISTGIHGDEPAGPLAARRLLQENRWPADLEIGLCPCLNRAGFLQNRRENPEGHDLNRDYLSLSTAEAKAHTLWLGRQPGFDLCLCLHEDWESDGFYVYELNPDNRPSLAETIVEHVAQVCPINTSDLIEGRAAHNGIIRPSIDPRSRPDWPEAFYLLTYKTRLSYTLEAPSDYALECRVAALAVGINAALQALGEQN
jgi:murein peptide amidase A